MLDNLPDDMIGEIMILLAKQDPPAFGNLRQSSTDLLNIANEPYVLQELDMEKLAYKLPHIDDPGRRFLQQLKNHQIWSAPLLIATDHFFKKQNRSQGIQSLIELVETNHYQALYNCTVAMTLTNHPDAPAMYRKITLIPDNRRMLKKLRRSFYSMVLQQDVESIPFVGCCTIAKPEHWVKSWRHLFLATPISSTCLGCCMDSEMFRVKRRLV
ncbi:hypothetical protein ACFE04_021632 [Oxalis oulophora]